MLEEALVALAAAGGTAVVQAAGTDAWNGFRGAVARLFGRGERGREHNALERLDRTAAAVLESRAAPGSGDGQSPGPAERTRIREQAAWQARFESLLESAAVPEQREQLAAGLRALLAAHGSPEPTARGVVSGNLFTGPTAVQVGSHNRQDNRFEGSPSPGPSGRPQP